MLLPAEIESNALIPAIRCIIAKRLSQKGTSEQDISRMLGVTQAAISNYIRGVRGNTALIERLLVDENITDMIDDICFHLSSDMAYTPASLSKFIGLCNYIKSSLLICDIHKDMESDIDNKICKECENMLLKGPGC